MKRAEIVVLMDPKEAEDVVREQRRIQDLIDEIQRNNFFAREKDGLIEVSCKKKHMKNFKYARYIIGTFSVWEQEVILGRMANHAGCCALIP